MASTPLPEDIRGEWVWNQESLTSIDSYVFLRRDFTLFETPQVAELWVTSSHAFHLYINGRHFTCGSMGGVGVRHYVLYFDVGYTLEVGNNSLAVVAHHIDIATYAQQQGERGFWCQLNLDGEPYVWTNDEWLTYPYEVYTGRQPRISRASTFVETVDLKRYPVGWQESDFKTDDWVEAGYTREVIHAELDPYPAFEPTSELVPVRNVLVAGRATCLHLTTHVCIAQAVKDAQGLFMAETFVQVPDNDDETMLYVFCDDPYYFFVNEELVKCQAWREPRDWADPRWDTPRCFQQEEVIDVVGTVILQPGWNKITFLQQVEPDSAGITLVFPALAAGSLKFLRGPDAFGLPGWNVAGPMRTPFSKIHGTVFVDNVPHTSYYKITPCDAAAHLLTYQFDSEEATLPPNELVLSEGDFAILELPQYTRGYLDCTFIGSAGDIVDVVYGNTLQGSVLSPYDRGTRKVITNTLREGECQWHSVEAHGMACIMVLARQAATRITIRDLSVRRLDRSFHEQNLFACSDELMNQIWEVGENTLQATYDYRFLNSAGFLEGQLLGDAMIQALASIALVGDFRLSEKALREFANAQLETGEIPALAPSDFHVSFYDFALLWPHWLQVHVAQSGDLELMQEMFPVLERLLAFFEGIAGPETMLIGDLEEPFLTPSLIDYDETVDHAGIGTCINSLYCNALLKSEWLFRQAERTEEADICHERAARLAHSLRKLTWNAEKGLFADCWCENERSMNYSLQANVLAIFGGIAPDCNRVFDNLFFEYAPFQEVLVDKDNENPYFKYFILEAAFAIGRRDWGIEYMRYYWGRMIQQGARTWWNKFSPDEEFDLDNVQSVCHGNGISPNYFLMREVVGIRPVTNGYKRLYFNPVLTSAEWVRARIHTPEGNFKIEWSYLESGELQIVIDSEYPLEIVPVLDKAVAENVVVHVSDGVTIIDVDDAREPTR